MEKGILYENEVDQLLEHFYQIKLTPLLEEGDCDVCGDYEGIKRCQVCKLRRYCGKKCRKLDQNHECTPYEDMWRVYSRSITSE
jgi:hypothetical protein